MQTGIRWYIATGKLKTQMAFRKRRRFQLYAIFLEKKKKNMGRSVRGRTPSPHKPRARRLRPPADKIRHLPEERSCSGRAAQHYTSTACTKKTRALCTKRTTHRRNRLPPKVKENKTSRQNFLHTPGQKRARQHPRQVGFYCGVTFPHYTDPQTSNKTPSHVLRRLTRTMTVPLLMQHARRCAAERSRYTLMRCRQHTVTSAGECKLQTAGDAARARSARKRAANRTASHVSPN